MDRGLGMRDLAGFPQALPRQTRGVLRITSPTWTTPQLIFGLLVSSTYLTMFIFQPDWGVTSPQWTASLFKTVLLNHVMRFQSRILREEYLSTLNTHINSNICVSCIKVHAQKG